MLAAHPPANQKPCLTIFVNTDLSMLVVYLFLIMHAPDHHKFSAQLWNDIGAAIGYQTWFTGPIIC